MKGKPIRFTKVSTYYKLTVQFPSISLLNLHYLSNCRVFIDVDVDVDVDITLSVESPPLIPPRRDKQDISEEYEMSNNMIYEG